MTYMYEGGVEDNMPESYFNPHHPGYRPGDLMEYGWYFLQKAIEKPSDETASYLPTARTALEIAASNPYERSVLSTVHFNACTALATWPLFTEWAEEQLPSSHTLSQVHHNLIALLDSSTRHNYDLRTYERSIANKLLSVLTLTLLARHSNPAHVACPSPPHTQFEYYDENGSPAHFHVFITTERGEAVPARILRDTKSSYLEGLAGALNVGVGSILLNAAEAASVDSSRFGNALKLSDALWLRSGQAIELLIKEASGKPLEDSENYMLARATAQIITLAENY